MIHFLFKMLPFQGTFVHFRGASRVYFDVILVTPSQGSQVVQRREAFFLETQVGNKRD